MVQSIRVIGNSIAQLVFPSTCVVCGETPEAGDYSCESCLSKLDLLRSQPACPSCAASPGPHMSPLGRCGTCRGSKLHFDATVRVAPYTEEMTALIQRFKYRGAEYLDKFLADLMCRSLSLASWRSEIEALVPVPSHWFRKLTTGFHVTEALVRQAARQLHTPRLCVLERVRLDPHQVGLSLPQRIQNVKGSFRLKRGAKVANASICVIDDVMTSGATLNEVARVLKEAGAARVWNLILARAGQQDAALGLA